MTPEESYSAFRAFLKARKRTLKSLTVPDACDFMFDFYREVRPTGTSPKSGDGMAFTYDIVQRQRGSPFELKLVRLFATSDEKLAIGGSRLRLSLGYSWLDVVSWFNQSGLERPPPNCYYAWDQDSARALLDELRSHRVYQVLKDHGPRSVELRHEPIWDLEG